ncbi:MAG: methyl-accepting chemotaxis protein [Rhodospirillaceae bacterium]|nr:methyl-accepting chemotaxis protein [Rhodospirillaceae bacterium]
MGIFSFYTNLKIAQKLPIVIAAFSVISAVVVGLIAYNKASTELLLESQSKLTAVGASRKAELLNYLTSIDQDLIVTSQNATVHQAAKEFTQNFNELGSSALSFLQDNYIHNNSNAAGEKHKLDYASDGSAYSGSHATYHPWFRELLTQRDYYDIFIFDADGNVVYTVFKELDYATNVMNGEWKDSDLGAIFRLAKDASKGSISFVDFKPYAPSAGVPASFIALPLYEGNSFLGVLAFQMPIAKINNIMQATAGMGESGESYLVGDDKLMRSDSRFSEESTILQSKVDTETVTLAHEGKSGAKIVPDYRGINVMSAYDLIDFHGVKWAVIAEIDEEEILAGSYEMRNFMLIVVIVLIGVSGGAGYLFARSITGPISNMTGVMGVLAGGDHGVEIPARDRPDEIGEMAGAVQVFKENMIKNEEMQEAQRKEDEIKRQRGENIEKMTADFDKTVAESLGAVASASTELNATSETMAASSEETTRQATAVAAAAEEASTNVQTVASASEELSSSIDEIRRQVSQSTDIAGKAVDEAKRTDSTVRSLSEAAGKIGDVVALITDIAEQTNLLALNATIEAARAGDAGKGFAVVANEVKSLANQTAKATDEIGGQIKGMQGVTEEAVSAIEGISSIIDEISTISTSIASAVEEQSAATTEISRNVQQAAAGTQEVTSNISGVNQAAGESGQAAGDVLSATKELSSQSETLRKEVDSFLDGIKNA